MILDIKHLRLAYGAHVLAPDVTFHLEGGECVLLAGANGCGKSTLLRTLACEGMYAETLRFATSLPVRNAPAGAAVGPSHSCGHGRPQVPAHTPSPAKCILIPTGISKVKGFTVEEFVRTGCFRESDWAGRLSEESERRLQGALDLLGLRAQAGQDIAKFRVSMADALRKNYIQDMRAQLSLGDAVSIKLTVPFANLDTCDVAVTVNDGCQLAFSELTAFLDAAEDEVTKERNNSF